MTTEDMKNVVMSLTCCDGDVDASTAALNLWIAKRSEAIDSICDLIDEAQNLLDNNHTFPIEVPSAVLYDMQLISIVDEEGGIHRLMEDANAQYALDEITNVVIYHAYAPTGDYWYIPNQEAYDKIEAWLAAGDELSVNQAQVVEYVGSVLSAYNDEPSMLTSIVAQGMQSSVQNIRDLATTILEQGTDTSLGAVANYLMNGMEGLHNITDGATTDADVGFQFDVENYKATATLDLLAGAWKLTASVLETVGTIAMVAGGAIIKAVGAICTVTSFAISKIHDAYTVATTMSIGNGATDLYANAIKTYVHVLASDKIQSYADKYAALYFKWGRILIGKQVTKGLNDHWIPMLIYFSSATTYTKPTGIVNGLTSYTKKLQYDMVYPATQSDVSDWMQDSAAVLRYHQEDMAVYPTDQGPTFGKIAFNVGSMALYFACLLCQQSGNIYGGNRMDLDYYFRELRSETDFYVETLKDYMWEGAAYWDTTENFSEALDVGASWYHSENALSDYLDPFLVASSVDVDFNTSIPVTGTFWWVVNSIWYRYLRDHNVSIPSGAALQGSYWQHVFENIYDISSGGNTLMYGNPGTSVTIRDFRVSADDRPMIPADPWITPPNISRKSAILSAVIAIGSIVAVSVIAFTVRRSLRKKRKLKAIRKEQKALQAQSDYLADPTNKVKANAFIKAQRKFQRYAARVGYASNSLGSFSLTSPAAVASLGEKLISYGQTDQGSAAQLEIMANMVDYLRACADTELAWMEHVDGILTTLSNNTESIIRLIGGTVPSSVYPSL